MRIGVIIETKEFEKSWNAMRFAVTARKGGNEVKVFLMGEAVEIESLHHEKFDVAAQVEAFHGRPAAQRQVVPAPKRFQIVKVRDHGDLLTAEGQVDELVHAMSV